MEGIETLWAKAWVAFGNIAISPFVAMSKVACGPFRLTHNPRGICNQYVSHKRASLG